MILDNKSKKIQQMLCKEAIMKEKKSTVIRGVLEEELERNERMKNRYLLELKKLPKGSIVLRKLGNQEYYYLNYRENKKVIAKYIGKKEVTDIKELQDGINKRKHLQEVIKNLKQEENEIKKALR